MPLFSRSALSVHQVIDGGRASFIHAERFSLAFWKLDAGAVLPLHRHPHEMAPNVMSGAIDLTVGDETYRLRAGDTFVIPPDVPHSAVALEASEVIDVFAPVREDYRALAAGSASTYLGPTTRTVEP
ncbi:cupin [Trinickia caryophylli]|uniref:Cupin domain-containing protein n=1 Tax=Trinickia caryophylli TaxID=28094 RepID=A0A1X7FJM7_TRICW|nr:cupin domain-containing protein [Trinickia caryophylli]TRX19282.1 cupin domain-containing protein [Trinickia caryophylli]GLU34062.1 cupin [Trinickia caryophylli]SMF53233.1 Cupin domain-containing protein [Trinickia caryophylli]